MLTHPFPLIVGINDLLDANTVQILLLVLSAFFGWIAFRNRSRLKKIETDSVEIRSQADIKKAADERQEQLLDLLKGLLEQNSRQGDLTQKAFEQSNLSNDRWQKTVDIQAQATTSIAKMVADFRDYSAGQHRETRERGDSLHTATIAAVTANTNALDAKLETVRSDVAQIKTDLNRRMDDMPTIIDQKFRIVDAKLGEMLAEIRKPA